MKRSAALRKEFAVTTPEDRSKIQESISQAIREAKRRPDPLRARVALTNEERERENLRDRERVVSQGWQEGGFEQRTEKFRRRFRRQGAPISYSEILQGLLAGLAAGFIGMLILRKTGRQNDEASIVL
jgi:hypothetical protein